VRPYNDWLLHVDSLRPLAAEDRILTCVMSGGQRLVGRCVQVPPPKPPSADLFDDEDEEAEDEEAVLCVETPEGKQIRFDKITESGEADIISRLVFGERRNTVLKVRDNILDEIAWLDDKNCDLTRGEDVLTLCPFRYEEVETALLTWTETAQIDDCLLKQLLDRRRLWKDASNLVRVVRPPADVGRTVKVGVPSALDEAAEHTIFRSPWYLTAPLSILRRQGKNRRPRRSTK